MGDSNAPEMITSNIRFGDVLAEGRSATVWNVTISKKDSEGIDTNEAYLLKQFHNQEAFVSEAAAYGRMQEIPALKDRVPRYYGVSPVGRSIILGKHDGITLEDVIWDLSDEERNSVKEILTETLRILNEAGIAHGKVESKNIILLRIKEGYGHVKLVNFSEAVLKNGAEVSEEWDGAEYTDRHAVAEIFGEVQEAKNHEKATWLVESLRNGVAIAEPQYRLATLLGSLAYPSEDLVRSIMEIYTNPDPVLALPLAEHLSRSHGYAGAIQMLTQAVGTSSDEHSIEMVLQLKVTIARYSARFRSDETVASTKGRYEEAERFYFSTPGASIADETVMTLRYELAEYYYDRYLYGPAMDVCIQTLEEAAGAGKEASLNILKKYSKLIEETKKRLSHLINAIQKDILKKKERSWRPWADLPGYEEKYHRAEEAERLYNYLWSCHRMTQVAVEA